MRSNKLLHKYYRQLVVEGGLRSSLFGLSIGFSVGFVVFVCGLILTKNLLLLGLILSISISIAAIVLTYSFIYRPTIKKVAARVDEHGFEERTITMVELEGSDSYIAEVQREDTENVLSKFSLNLMQFTVFVKPMIILLCITALMVSSVGFMIAKVNAAVNEPPVVDELSEDEILQQMIDDLLSIINNSNINVELKSELYQMVVDLEQRLPTYDTYLEKYTDILETRNEILQKIEDAIIEIEDSLKNIAEALQQYENTEDLGTALLTWDLEIISAAFDSMYDRIDDLLGQELYDVMNQTAIDIEAALAEAVGTDQAMHDALQALADAYKIAIEDFQPGEEEDMLMEFEGDMGTAEQQLLDAVQALIDLVEELLELEEEIEEEIDQVDQFPIFMPFPEESEDGDDPGDPTDTSQNTVIDGETPYEEVYDSYYEDAMEWLSGENVSEDIRQIIEDYFDMLQK